MRSRVLIGVVLLVGSASAVLGVGGADAATATTVTVDAASGLAPLNNPAWYQNQTGPPLPPGHEERTRTLAPRLTRIWSWTPGYSQGRPPGQYDFNYVTANGTRLYEYYDQAARYSDRLMMNVLQCERALMNDPAGCRTVLKAGIEHYKQRYPTLEYIELFNEPDKTWPVGPNDDLALAPAEYYRWYKIGYSIVNEINEQRPAVPLKIGGPVSYRFNQTYIDAFLREYAADPDPAKRLDFISYHQYQNLSTPAQVGTEKQTVRELLGANGLPADVPVVVSEYGVFPGGATGSTFEKDLLTQAAAMATLGTYYVRSGIDKPMHWVFNHRDNDRKSMFVDGADGAVYPYYNLVRMQTMLKRNRVDSVVAPAPAPGGRGVNVLATVDDSGLAALVTNYQAVAGTDSHTVRLDQRNLPAAFAGREIRVDRYLIDGTTSNYTHNPADDDLRRVERYVLAPGAPVRSFTLTPNAMSLVVLTPLTHGETEDLPTTMSPGDTATDITDQDASGQRLNKFAGNAVGDHVRYTLRVPKADTYEVWLRVKKTPDRAVAQLDIDGVPLGGSVDGYSTGYEFVDVNVGRRILTAGDHPVTLTLTGTSGGGYTVGVDHIELVPVVRHHAELERWIPHSPSNDPVALVADRQASGGAFVKFDSNAIADRVETTFTVPAPGRYLLAVGVKRLSTRGICQFTVNGTPVGEPRDLYSSAASFETLPVAVVNLPQAGPATLGCTVTGRNGASTGFDVALDHLVLTPTS